MAWMLLWRGTIAQKRLQEKLKKKQIEFYAGQLKTAHYFFSAILPVTFGKMEAIQNLGCTAIEISDTAFGGK
jgi:predicted enzyme related to lactoylglutathione lyase